MAFFPKSGNFFRFSKTGRGGLPLYPGYVPVSVAKYASISLTIHKYLWKYWNKLFWLCQGFEYAWSSCMLDRLLKMSGVLNVRGFWIWHGSICEGYTEFWTWVNMAQNASLIPEYTLMFLSVSEHDWILLNVPKYAWKYLDKLFWLCQCSRYASGIKCARVLNMLLYSYNNIIIVINVIILEFLSAQFVYLGAPQLTILSF